MYVFLNNKFLQTSKAKISVLDSGFLYGDGIYETIRTYNGKIFNLNNHFNRLKKSAKLLDLKTPFSKKELETWIYTLIKKNKIKEARIRVTLTPGAVGFDKDKKAKPTLLIQTEKLKLPTKKELQNGVSVITYKAERVHPEAKSICQLPQILARVEMRKKKAYEVLLINKKNKVTEGSITNFYLIKNKTLLTPGKDILEGTTRKIILKIAKKLLKIKIKDIKLSDLYKADECFISNAPRGILPVVKINRKKVGKGKPGVYTKEIMQEFKKQLPK